MILPGHLTLDPDFAAAWDALYPHEWGKLRVRTVAVGVDGRIGFR